MNYRIIIKLCKRRVLYQLSFFSKMWVVLSIQIVITSANSH